VISSIMQENWREAGSRVQRSRRCNKEKPIRDQEGMVATNKQKLFQALFIFLIIGVLAFMSWMFMWIKSESGQCVRDPLEYYAEKIDHECGEDQKYEISCNFMGTNNFQQDINLDHLKDFPILETP